MKYIFSILFTLIILCFNDNVLAGEKVKFEFQNYVGEGQHDLYRVEVDIPKLKGEMCYFDTGNVTISKELSDQLTNGISWSRLIDINKVEHACFKFDLYNPFGWFYSSPFKYGDAEYKLFFIGTIKKDKIEGVLYEFRDYQPEGSKRVIKTVNQTKISVTASHD